MSDLRKLMAVALVGMTISAGVEAANSVATQAGFDLGFQLSDYRYKEESVEVTLDGYQYAMRGAYTKPVGDVFFARGEVRVAQGSLEYRGSGTKTGVRNDIFEGRVLAGWDLAISSDAVVAPFVGLGYRYLSNDLRGETSTGALGYRRISQYLYAPVGLNLRLAMGGGWVASPSIEYDHFIRGQQDSKLTDTGISGLIDAKNKQKKGKGYRAAAIFEKDHLSFGPWIQFWNIEDSDIVPVSATLEGLEPENKTLEAGIEINYRF